MNRSRIKDAQAASSSSSVRPPARREAGGWDEKAFSDDAVEDDAEETEETFVEDPQEEGRALAVCLVSGGMDSCVTAAIAREENDELAFLHVSYGQRTEARERRAFAELAGHHGVTGRPAVSQIGRAVGRGRG